jgi:hypothetical protein
MAPLQSNRVDRLFELIRNNDIRANFVLAECPSCVNLTKDGATVLTVALEAKNLTTVDQALDIGVTPENLRTASATQKALDLAIVYNHPEVVKRILSIDPTLANDTVMFDGDEMNALSTAIFEAPDDDYKIIDMLIDARARFIPHYLFGPRTIARVKYVLDRVDVGKNDLNLLYKYSYENSNYAILDFLVSKGATYIPGTITSPNAIASKPLALPDDPAEAIGHLVQVYNFKFESPSFLPEAVDKWSYAYDSNKFDMEGGTDVREYAVGLHGRSRSMFNELLLVLSREIEESREYWKSLPEPNSYSPAEAMAHLFELIGTVHINPEEVISELEPSAGTTRAQIFRFGITHPNFEELYHELSIRGTELLPNWTEWSTKIATAELDSSVVAGYENRAISSLRAGAMPTKDQLFETFKYCTPVLTATIARMVGIDRGMMDAAIEFGVCPETFAALQDSYAAAN